MLVLPDQFDSDSSTMSESNSLWITICCSFAVQACISACYKYIDTNYGKDWRIHAAYLAVAICSVAFIPVNVASYIFTSLTVTFVGCVYPIYRATKAVCTPDDKDDKEWLQYWMMGGLLFMLTTWVDDNIKKESVDTKWLGSLLFLFHWLYFPLTCGALLVYEKFTLPVLGPIVKPVQTKMNNIILSIYQAMSNVVHLYLVGIIFLFLPTALKRFVSVAIGTVYPFVCSVTAAASEEIEDDTYWLTYWAVYGCLFLGMDLTESVLGSVPGYYMAVIFLTVYLMLPMFRGADKVFRKFLVPLAGLQELLILRDSIMIKKQLLKDLDPERAQLVRKSISKFFDGDDHDSDPEVLKQQFTNSWQSMPWYKSAKTKMANVTMPNISFGNLTKGGKSHPTETTNLV